MAFLGELAPVASGSQSPGVLERVLISKIALYHKNMLNNFKPILYFSIQQWTAGIVMRVPIVNLNSVESVDNPIS